MSTKSIRLLAGLISLLLTALVGRGQSYSNAVMNLHPVAYWPLQETTPPPNYDVETNLGSFGSIANVYYTSTNVLHGQGGAVPGDNSVHTTLGGFGIVPTTDQRVSLPAGGPFSVECWVRADGVLGFRGLVSQTGPSQNGLNGSTNGSGWEMSINYAPYRFTAGPNAPPDWTFHVFNGVGQTGGAEADTLCQNVWLSGGQNGYTNVWVYLCGVFDGTNCLLYEYSTNMDNATFGGTNSMTLQFPITTAPGAPFGGPPDTNSYPNAQFSPDTWDPIQIGQERGYNVNQWVGNIDEVAIYTNALTSAQVLSHFQVGTNSATTNYQATILADNPVMYWRMDAPAWVPVVNNTFPTAANYGSAASSMTNLNTHISGANAGVYQPGTVPGVPGPSYPAFGDLTNACAFNGLDGAVDAGYNPLLDPTGLTNNFTMVAWVKGNPMDIGRFEAIASHSDSSWKGQVNTGTASAYKGVNPQASIAPARYNVNDGQWHLYAVEGTPSGITLNLDAAYIATLPNSSFIPGNTNVDAWIGGAPDHAEPTNHASYNTGQQSFAGEICHVAYFTNALTLEQINGLYSMINPALVLGTQPVSGAANAGDSYSIFVGASGQQLFYQWYKDNAPIPNQTNAALSLNPVQPSDASDNYYVVITNSLGSSLTSTQVSLTVYTNPVFSQIFPVAHTDPITLYGGQIVNGTNYLGSTPSFSVRSLLGAKPFAFQWLTNGVPVAGATDTNFTFANCQLDGPTSFSCVASNIYGAATNTWSVSYLPAPTAPFPQAVLAANPIAYWRLNEPDDGAFDGNNGAICNDYQSANNGIYTNMILSNASGDLITVYSPTTDPTEQPAKFGSYNSKFSFAGQIGTNIDLATPAGSNGEFTVAVWVECGTVNGGTVQNGNAGIVTKGAWSGEQFTLDEGAPGTSLRWVVRTASTALGIANSTVNLNSDLTWHYVVGVCDQVNGMVYIYIDGKLAGRGTVPVGGGILPSTEPVTIGCRKDSAGNYTVQFKGFLNDAAIYKYAMTPGQIVSQYASVGGTNAPYFFPSAPAANAGAAVNTTLTIPATAIGTPPLGYVWTNLTTGANVSGGTTNGNTLNATLAYANVPAAWNNNQLELIVTNAYGMTNAFVTLSITNTVNANPTNILFSVTGGNQLTLSWPADHTGWRLQSQTNAPGVGIGSNWHDVIGANSTNLINFSIDPSNGSVFYRMVYP
jgi:hypothetical protein